MVTTILGNGRALSGAGRDAGYTNFRDASQAKENAQANLQRMFDVACGKDACKVEVEWVDSTAEVKSE